MTFRRGTGWLPDPPDPRDRPLAAHRPVAAVPSWSTVDVGLPSRDQGRTSECVGFCWTSALRVAHLANGEDSPELSPHYTYFRARETHDAAGVDAGTYVRAAAKVTMRMGAASMDTFPFSEATVNQSPPFPASYDAADRKGLRGYYRCYTPDDVRAAIAQGFPVVGGWELTEDWFAWTGPEVVQNLDGEKVGGHCMMVVAYATDGTFTLWNTSWTDQWRHRGRQRVSELVVQLGSDLWAVDVKGGIKP